MTGISPQDVRLNIPLKGLDPAEAAFRAVGCLDAAQRIEFQTRFNSVFGQCTPKLTIRFVEDAA